MTTVRRATCGVRRCAATDHGDWLGNAARRTSHVVRSLLSFLRAWSGDDAYERYLAEHRQHGHALLSRREFYRRYLDHRAGGSRCC